MGYYRQFALALLCAASGAALLVATPASAVTGSSLQSAGGASAASPQKCAPGEVWRVRPTGNHDRTDSTSGACVTLGCTQTVDASTGKIQCTTVRRPPVGKIIIPL
jgi:hypothetical protein